MEVLCSSATDRLHWTENSSELGVLSDGGILGHSEEGRMSISIRADPLELRVKDQTISPQFFPFPVSHWCLL